MGENRISIGISAIMLLVCMAISTQGWAAASEDHIWEDISPAEMANIARRGEAVPEGYRMLRADIAALERTLSQAPLEERPGPDTVLSLPMPGGEFQRFLVEESPVMAPALAAKFPEIKTYRGINLDDPHGTARFDLTPKGFHAILHSKQGTVYIDPDPEDQAHSPELYRSFFKQDFKPDPEKKLECHADEDHHSAAASAFRSPSLSSRPSGNELRIYRIAIAATGEYTQFHGGTVAQALAAIVSTLNRVNFIYEREVAIRMMLVDNNDSIIYQNPISDPYTNNRGRTMLDENQANLDFEIGNENYDIGHVFSTGGGGIAKVGVVCQTGDKAQGVTGLSNPIGDPFDVDFVAHEVGHQFSAQHTFNGTAGSCTSTARKNAFAYEPGSGSTIMSYAGICDEHNLQPHTDPYFHGVSFDQIIAYTTLGAGGNCPTTITTLNNPPTGVNAGPSYIIPLETPFTLSGAAFDPDGDLLTYNWEQFDLGPAGDPRFPEGSAPIFRSFPPTNEPFRTFPRLSDLLNNTSTLGEQLPTEARNLNFRFTARDNRAGGGGVDYAEVALQVTDLAGPFRVAEANTPATWASGTTKTVAWEVADTDIDPINCTQVNIRLSIDGGESFPLTLATATANDGSESITVPETATTQARLKVECADNIFFDISDTDFTITGALPDVIFADGFES